MSGSRKLVIGAGPVGRATAEMLGDAGHEVTLVSRRGTHASRARVKSLAMDASDAKALADAAAGATTIFNCAMPRYDRWPEEFPPIAEAVLVAAEESGADLVTLGNVYGYGAGADAFTEAMPMAPTTVKGSVRAKMWEVALTSRARVTEVRASDFLGHGVVSYFTLFVLPGLMGGSPILFPGDPETVHSWSFTQDVAQTLVAASRSERSWGRAWHVPSNDLSVVALAKLTARIAGCPEPDLQQMPMSELERLAAEDSMMREVVEMTYLFDRPCRLDWAETGRTLGVSAAPVEQAVRETLRT